MAGFSEEERVPEESEAWSEAFSVEILPGKKRKRREEMGLHEDLNDMKDLANIFMSDKKEENRKKERERKTVELTCPYCGSVSRYVWEEGNLPTCPNCGAPFDADDEQLKKIREQRDRDAETERRVYEAQAIEKAKTKSKIRKYIIIGVILIVLIIVAVIAAKLNGGSLHLGGDATFNFHID